MASVAQPQTIAPITVNQIILVRYIGVPGAGTFAAVSRVARTGARTPGERNRPELSAGPPVRPAAGAAVGSFCSFRVRAVLRAHSPASGLLLDEASDASDGCDARGCCRAT